MSTKKSTQSQAVAPVSAVQAVIAQRGTEYKPTNKAGYLRALLVAVVADFKAGVDVSYVSSCNNYVDTASGKGVENRVGRAEGQPNSRRCIRAMVSQELALLGQDSVANRLARMKPDSAAAQKLKGMDSAMVIQIVQDGSTAFDSTINKLAGKADDELHTFAKWFRDTTGSAWQSKVAPESLPVEAVAEVAAEAAAE